jgi:hypothetical protein
MPTNSNTAEPAKPDRRWFQFRLRTLLIGVAVVATLCSLGVPYLQRWQARRDQEELVRQQQKIVDLRDRTLGNHRIVAWYSQDERDEYASKIPLLRRQLGDHYESGIVLGDFATNAQIEEYQAAFPEAEVIRESVVVNHRNGK